MHFARPAPRHFGRLLRHGQRRPPGNGPRALPGLLVVGDAGEPAAHLDRSRELTILLEGSTNSLSIGFGYDEHGWEDGKARRVRQGLFVRRRVTARYWSATQPT